MSNAPTTPVRLKDIAQDLNVSVMTVSKVVRGCADVGAETRSRVLARIKELNYQPNWVARSLATRHLIERGCRRIVHIAGPPLTPGVGRLKGYQDALAAAGIVVPDSYIVHATDDASGYLAARRLLALDPRPDAIFGYNDPTAAGAMKAILEAGIAIPDEIKVMGVGNVHYSDLLRVPLSTIDQSSTAIGQQAADMLIKSITSKRKRPAKAVLIDPILIARESTRLV
jgi:LacI family transcriptional regulator